MLTLELAPLFGEAIEVDPDPDMLAEAASPGGRGRTPNVRWVRGLAEDLAELAPGPFRVVSFGRSFHWTEREQVAEAAYDLLEPGGALVLVGQSRDDPPPTDAPDLPLVPRDAIMAVVERYLGPERRAGQASRPAAGLERRRARPHEVRPAAARHRARPRGSRSDADAVLSNVLSTAYAAPHLFGDRLTAFEADAAPSSRAARRAGSSGTGRGTRRS